MFSEECVILFGVRQTPSPLGANTPRDRAPPKRTWDQIGTDIIHPWYWHLAAATAVVGAHLTGMHSCFLCSFLYHHIQDGIQVDKSKKVTPKCRSKSPMYLFLWRDSLKSWFIFTVNLGDIKESTYPHPQKTTLNPFLSPHICLPSSHSTAVWSKWEETDRVLRSHLCR